jgi:hypothetical protein
VAAHVFGIAVVADLVSTAGHCLRRFPASIDTSARTAVHRPSARRFRKVARTPGPPVDRIRPEQRARLLNNVRRWLLLGKEAHLVRPRTAGHHGHRGFQECQDVGTAPCEIEGICQAG